MLPCKFFVGVMGQKRVSHFVLHTTYALAGMGEGHLDERRGTLNEDVDRIHEHYDMIIPG